VGLPLADDDDPRSTKQGVPDSEVDDRADGGSSTCSESCPPLEEDGDVAVLDVDTECLPLQLVWHFIAMWML